MAQAARLSLRMQKELKLLLSDPPPGTTFPYLTSDCASLAAIDAQIEGPKGTVYENGYFHIKIQIPERYPFQPPVVTFATPIYHPNIDTGGRICLDILNLPPKGAWQPSLNISTVITSIRLLLSEPNPDDGLMCEASKEYKYNRQAFVQKARSMTENYAKALSSGSSSNEDLLISSSSGQGDAKVIKNEVRSEVNNLKPQNPSRKLSLQSSVSTSIMKSNDMRVADQPNISPPNSQNETERSLKSKQDPGFSNRNEDKFSGMRRKLSLSLEGSCQFAKKSCDETKTTLNDVVGGGISYQDVYVGIEAKPPDSQKQSSSCSNAMQNDKANKTQQITHPASTGSCSKLPISSVINLEDDYCELKFPITGKNLLESNLSLDQHLYKHRVSNKKLKLGYQKVEDNNKENIPQVALHHPTSETNQPCEPHLVSSSVIDKQASGRTINSKINSRNQEQGIRSRLSLRPLRSLQANHEPKNEVQGESEPPISSEVIVMDSEDEEENEIHARSKVMVARRRLGLAGKRKAKE